jgi:hypothetical protein
MFSRCRSSHAAKSRAGSPKPSSSSRAQLAGHDLRALGLDLPVADAHPVGLVHQLGDEIKVEVHTAKGLDPPLRRHDDLRVLHRVLKIIRLEHLGVRGWQSVLPGGNYGIPHSRDWCHR